MAARQHAEADPAAFGITSSFVDPRDPPPSRRDPPETRLVFPEMLGNPGPRGARLPAVAKVAPRCRGCR